MVSNTIDADYNSGSQAQQSPGTPYSSITFAWASHVFAGRNTV